MCSREMAMTKGRGVTTRDELLIEAAKTLAPNQSLDRVDKVVAYLTTAVAVAASLATGFGTLSATELADVDVWWSLPTTVLAAASVVCAILATVPGAATVPPGDLMAVEAYFREQIRRRGRLVRGAAAALATALLLAPLPVVVAAFEKDDASADLTIVIGGNTANVKLSASHLNAGGRVTVTAVADHQVVAVAVGDVTAKGSISLALPLPKLPGGTPVKVTAVQQKRNVARPVTFSVPQSASGKQVPASVGPVRRHDLPRQTAT